MTLHSDKVSRMLLSPHAALSWRSVLFLLLLVCKYKNNVTASKKSYGLSKLPHFALSENRRFTLVNRESEFVLC